MPVGLADDARQLLARHRGDEGDSVRNQIVGNSFIDMRLGLCSSCIFPATMACNSNFLTANSRPALFLTTCRRKSQLN